jgi:molecular chaperone DnaK
VEGLVSDLRQAINKDDIDRVKSLSEELKQAMYALSSAMYQQSGSSTSTSSSGGRDSSDGDVIDADFTESK